MKLKEGEVIIKEGGALYRVGEDRTSFLRLRARLHLTNQRLVFEYVGMSLLSLSKKEIEIPLAAIKSVQLVQADPFKSRRVKVEYNINRGPRIFIFEPFNVSGLEWGAQTVFIAPALCWQMFFEPSKASEWFERVDESAVADVWVTQIRRMANLAAKSKPK